MHSHAERGHDQTSRSHWVTAIHRRSRLAGECSMSANTFIDEPPRSPARRLLQRKCVLSGVTMIDQKSLKQRALSRAGFSREAFDLPALLLILIFVHITRRRHLSRLGCRPNADDAQWAEPHGCGESAVRTWMSVRRGPTERRRSEGTPTEEEPNQEHKPLVTWGFLK
jgi:hypothetical protein